MVASTAWKGNPYVIGTPIDDKRMFFGRESALRFIEDNLRQGAKVILLYGQRRIGKSSVLAQIPEFIGQDQFYFVPFDLQNQGKRLLGQVLYSLSTVIVERLEDDYDLLLDDVEIPSEADLLHDVNHFSNHFLPQIFKRIGTNNLVLLLDEFDVLSNYSSESAIEHFFPYLQSIISIHDKLFIIPAIGRRPEELDNLLSLFKSAPAQEIGLLDEQSARSLITKPSEGVLSFEPDAIQAIVDLTSKHPYFTQVVCFSIFGQARAQQQWMVSKTDVAQIVDKAIESSRPGLTWFRDSLPIPERVIFSAVAEAQQIAITTGNSIIQSPFSLLEEYGIVQTTRLARAGNQLMTWGFLDALHPATQTSSKFPVYTVKIELVRRWLVEAYPLRKEAWELEKLNAEAQRLYDEASELYRTKRMRAAIKKYRDALEVNPNHFSALFELADAYFDDRQFAGAVKYYQRAFKLDANRVQDEFVQALFEYGRDLRRRGDINQARKQFTRVLEIEPDHVAARQHLEQVEAAIGQKYLSAPNPFTVGQPVSPDRFIGRSAELATALDQISRHGHLAVWGGPGIGKTSFLQQLAFPQVWEQHGFDASNVVVLMVSCLSIAPPFTASGFWFEVLSLVRDELDDLPELQAEVDEILDQTVFTVKHLRQVLRKLGKQNKSLVLLIDDYEEALRPNEQYTESDVAMFLSEQRSLAAYSTTIQRHHISMVVSTSRPLSGLGPQLGADRSPWFNHYLFLPLQALTQPEAETLLRPIPMSPSLQEDIWRIAGGNPTLLQIAGSLLYTELRSGRLPESEEFTQAFLSQSEPFFQYVWTALTDIEQVLLILIVLRDVANRSQQYQDEDVGSVINRTLSQRERELLDLTYWGIITPSYQGDMSYSFSSCIMEWWVFKQVQNSNPEDWQKRQSVFFSLMSNRHVKHIANLIRLIWQRSDLRPSLTSWISHSG